MNGMGKPFRKSNEKLKKTVKKSKIASYEQKTNSEKATFCCSLCFKIRAKIHAAKPLAFSLQFLFRGDQNHHLNLTSKIMKMCEQVLKKDSTPVQFKLFE